jgi:hypothetical protein
MAVEFVHGDLPIVPQIHSHDIDLGPAKGKAVADVDVARVLRVECLDRLAVEVVDENVVASLSAAMIVLWEESVGWIQIHISSWSAAAGSEQITRGITGFAISCPMDARGRETIPTSATIGC